MYLFLSYVFVPPVLSLIECMINIFDTNELELQDAYKGECENRPL